MKFPKCRSTTWLLLAAFFVSAPAPAVQPIIHYHDLVAGKGDHGFRDGSFTQACFNNPSGMAVSPDGKKLYVSDRDNHRIRLIDLDDQNKVSTVAGSGRAGKTDGPLLDASFNKPTALVYLPSEKLLVYDSSNGLLREVDLKTKTVRTFAGNVSRDIGPAGGPLPQLDLRALQYMVYAPDENAVYYSQPMFFRLGKINLDTKWAQSVAWEQPAGLRVASLCVLNNHLCFSDASSSKVFRVDFPSNTLSAASLPASLIPIGEGRNILAMAASGEKIYALQGGNTRCATVNPYSPVSLVSIWGPFFDSGENNEPVFLNFDASPPVFIADPSRERRFFVTNTNLNAVYSFKDYSFYQFRDGNSKNRDSLSDYDYPTNKPPHTFRILIVGDSMTFVFSQAEQKRLGYPNRVLNVAKRLELYLNTAACLEDRPVHFEVFNLSSIGSAENMLTTVHHYVPGLVEKYDIDLALYNVACQRTAFWNIFFQRPLSPEGVPALTVDPEYLLKPPGERVPPGAPSRFYERCLKKGWVDGELHFKGVKVIPDDEELRKDVVEMVGMPVKQLHKSIGALRTSGGKQVAFWICFIPQGAGNEAVGDFQAFWTEVGKKYGIPLLDLTDPFLALRPTFWPINEAAFGDHLNEDGHLFWAMILARELVHRNMVPF